MGTSSLQGFLGEYLIFNLPPQLTSIYSLNQIQINVPSSEWFAYGLTRVLGYNYNNSSWDLLITFSGVSSYSLILTFPTMSVNYKLFAIIFQEIAQDTAHRVDYVSVENIYLSATYNYNETNNINSISTIAAKDLIGSNLYFEKLYPKFSGQLVNTKFYSNSNISWVGGTTFNFTTVNTGKIMFFLSYSPVLPNSFIEIYYQVLYTINGSGADSWSSILYECNSTGANIIGSKLGQLNQVFLNAAGSGTRSSVLYPITGFYNNLSVNTKYFCSYISVATAGTNDTITFDTSSSFTTRIIIREYSA